MHKTTFTLFILLILGTAVKADPISFDFIFTGDGNPAMATGTIVFESTMLPNPGLSIEGGGGIDYAAVLDLSLTVSGAAAGNGTYNRDDFGDVAWSTNGATLDFTRQMVGQPTNNDPWGTPNFGAGGDFNLFSGGGKSLFNEQGYESQQPPQGSPAPNGTFWFTLSANGGNGDAMILSSFGPSTPQTVPALNWLSVLVLALILASISWFTFKRKTV